MMLTLDSAVSARLCCSEPMISSKEKQGGEGAMAVDDADNDDVVVVTAELCALYRILHMASRQSQAREGQVSMLSGRSESCKNRNKRRRK